MSKTTSDTFSYQEMMDRLGDEKQRIEQEFKKDYRRSRKYVRANPEKSVTFSFFTGLLSGILLSTLFIRRK